MTKRQCGNCRWFARYSAANIGECRKAPPEFEKVHDRGRWPVIDDSRFCGEWADKNITPEQAERRELVRRFAVAIVAGDNRAFSCEPTFVWQLAEQYVDAEEQA